MVELIPVANPVNVDELVRKELLLRGRVLPWIVTIVIALSAQRFAWLLYDTGVLSAGLAWDVVLFCGVIAGGVAPRAIPRAVQLRVTDHGMSVRDVLFFAQVTWNEVVGPFEVRRTLLGEAIYFQREIREHNKRLKTRIMFQNNFEIPSKVLADILNSRRSRPKEAPN